MSERRHRRRAVAIDRLRDSHTARRRDEARRHRGSVDFDRIGARAKPHEEIVARRVGRRRGDHIVAGILEDHLDTRDAGLAGVLDSIAVQVFPNEITKKTGAGPQAPVVSKTMKDMAFERHHCWVAASNVRACAKSGTPSSGLPQGSDPVMWPIPSGNHDTDIDDRRREADLEDPDTRNVRGPIAGVDEDSDERPGVPFTVMSIVSLGSDWIFAVEIEKVALRGRGRGANARIGRAAHSASSRENAKESERREIIGVGSPELFGEAKRSESTPSAGAWAEVRGDGRHYDRNAGSALGCAPSLAAPRPRAPRWRGAPAAARAALRRSARPRRASEPSAPILATRAPRGGSPRRGGTSARWARRVRGSVSTQLEARSARPLRRRTPSGRARRGNRRRIAGGATSSGVSSNPNFARVARGSATAEDRERNRESHPRQHRRHPRKSSVE